MKVCVTCHEWKSLEAFNVRSAAPDGRQARCRECCKAWYAANSSDQKAAVVRRNQRHRQAIRQQLAEYLLVHPCVDCGEDDLRVLEFDHRPGADKRGEIGRLLNGALSWPVIEAEIAKCDVRCANCHRRRTAERGGWWRQGVYEATMASLAAGE